MGALYLNESTIFLLGGMTHRCNEISNKVYLFDATCGEACQLPPMFQERYNFPVIVHNYRLFAIGGSTYGRNDHTRLLKDVEYFDFSH